jgi:hypothetical protein
MSFIPKHGVIIAMVAMVQIMPVQPMHSSPLAQQATKSETKTGEYMNREVKDFFLKFEKANLSSDVPGLSRLYADTFMFGGPKGVQAVKKEDFLKVIPKMKSYFSSMGLSETQLKSVETSPVNSRFLLVKVSWGMKLQTASGFKHLDTLATYILERGDGELLSIVFQIDHQDLATLVRELQNAER